MTPQAATARRLRLEGIQAGAHVRATIGIAAGYRRLPDRRGALGREGQA